MKLELLQFVSFLCQACSLLLGYQNFELEYSCDKRSADRFSYTLESEGAHTSPRNRAFTLDPTLDPSCQQLSTDSYMNVHRGFNRGHLVTAHHMNANRLQRKEYVPFNRKGQLHDQYYSTSGEIQLGVVAHDRRINKLLPLR
jgi:DNA/RNA non-specific endonuclease